MPRALIVAWALVVLAGALYTGARGGFAICSMTGFLPPHYGYSAYAISVLPFLAPWPWVRWLAGAALLASGNRASWVGGIVSWVFAGGRRRALLGAFLCVAATLGGLAMKPRGAVGDSVRIKVWRAALKQSFDPARVGEFCIGVDGNLVTKAHSDVLQLAAERGWKAAVGIVLAVLLGLWLLPASPEKAVLVGLSFVSVIDNRLTTSWACLGLYAALWALATTNAIGLRRR